MNKPRVYIFRWIFPLGAYPSSTDPGEARGEKVFSTDAARQEFIRRFGDAADLIGIACWQSYTCTFDCEVL